MATLRNVGSFDRMMRIVVGIFLLSLIFIGPQTPWGWLGVPLLLTGMAGHCPLYTLLRRDSCHVGGVDTCR